MSEELFLDKMEENIELPRWSDDEIIRLNRKFHLFHLYMIPKSDRHGKNKIFQIMKLAAQQADIAVLLPVFIWCLLM